ncbi:MAG: hypothetical protein RLN62_05405 [Rickettsiales bacterium]
MPKSFNQEYFDLKLLPTIAEADENVDAPAARFRQNNLGDIIEAGVIEEEEPELIPALDREEPESPDEVLAFIAGLDEEEPEFNFVEYIQNFFRDLFYHEEGAQFSSLDAILLMFVASAVLGNIYKSDAFDDSSSI